MLDSTSWSKRFKGAISSNLNTSLRHTQNGNTGQMIFTLPEIAYNVNRFYPFKMLRKNSINKNLTIILKIHNARHLEVCPNIYPSVFSKMVHHTHVWVILPGHRPLELVFLHIYLENLSYHTSQLRRQDQH